MSKTVGVLLFWQETSQRGYRYYELPTDHEMDLIGSLIKSFTTSERSALAHFTLLSPAAPEGPGREILQRPPSVCLSVTFSFRTVTRKRIDAFS